MPKFIEIHHKASQIIPELMHIFQKTFLHGIMIVSSKKKNVQLHKHSLKPFLITFHLMEKNGNFHIVILILIIRYKELKYHRKLN